MVRWLPIATHALILSLAAKIGFVKIVIDLKNSLRSDIYARIIWKREISGRNGRTGAILSKRESPVQNGRVETCDGL